jgi:hypothetical protein
LIESITEKTQDEQKFQKWQKSVESFIDLAEKKNDQMLRAFALRYAARYYFCRGSKDKAIELTQEAISNFLGNCIPRKSAEEELHRYLNLN